MKKDKKKMKKNHPQFDFKLLSILFFTLLYKSTYAQSVKDLCPDSKVIKEAKDLKTVLERFPDERSCSIGDDETVEKLSAEIINILLQSSKQIKTPNGQGLESLESVYNVARTYNLYQPLDKLALLIEQEKMKQSPPRDKAVIGINKSGAEFNSLVAELAKKENKSQADLDLLREKEKEYIESVKKVMAKTSEGKKALKCYESPSRQISSRLPQGKMPEIRLSSSLLIEQNRPLETAIGGSFSTVCTHTDPLTFETEVSLNDAILKPMEMVYEMTHELRHACDAEDLGNASLEKKLADQSKIPESRIGKFAPVLKELKVESLADIAKSNMFIRWLKQPKNSPGASGNQQAQNPMMISFAAAAKKLEEGGLTPGEFENFLVELSQDKKLMSPIYEAEKKMAFTQAKSEIVAFRTALQMFKELAAVDPSYCSITNSGTFAYGPILYSPADFFRTLEETDLKDHIMNLYSYKNGMILRDFIYQTKDQSGQKSKFPSKESVLVDSEGRPIYNAEFADFLKSI